MGLETHRARAPEDIAVFVLTLSDTRTAATDASGQLLEETLRAAGHRVIGRRILREEPATLGSTLERLFHEQPADVFVLTGGTGVAPRDVTYDVLAALYERSLPGFGELFRMLSYEAIGSAALLSRASAGVVAGRLIVSLPGSTRAVRLALDRLLLPELGHLVGELRRAPTGEAPL